MAVSLDYPHETPFSQPPPSLNMANNSPTEDYGGTAGGLASAASYQNPSSTSATRPALNLPSASTTDAQMSTSTVVDGRMYSLDIMQQPVRARMCGFGDKDRRPITPPPCIRLIVKDIKTDREVDINEIDTSYLVLTVDLWSADLNKEVNLVRHSATSPTISAANTTSYPPPTEEVPAPLQAFPMPLQAVAIPSYPTDLNAYGTRQTPHHSGLPHPQTSQNVQVSAGHYSTPVTPTAYVIPGAPHGQLLSPAVACDPRSSPAGMFTRNLIGSLCVSAFKLTDPMDTLGVWFILQDLSVRTEGTFRLKMNFVNVGSPHAGQILNTAAAPVLASVFSDKFDVYSAKKFPGVIESTELSKCFATQGIKIPIRKDGVRGNERKPGEGEDDD